MRHPILLAAVAATGLAACAATAGNMADGIASRYTPLGTVLTNEAGMTLYTFDKDKPGISNCYDGCAMKWPPVLATAGGKLAAGYSLVNRKDGTHQIAYHDMPLYTWFKDSKPGDTTGDGVKGVWHVAKP